MKEFSLVFKNIDNKDLIVILINLLYIVLSNY
jgi:hypothetical protein